MSKMTNLNLYEMFYETPIGWIDCFGKLLLEDIEKVLTPEQFEDFYFIQIKEKWGVLDAYPSIMTTEVDMILQDYSFFSGQVCIGCGKVGVPTTKTGWVMPICPKCWEKISSNLKYDEAMILDGFKGFEPKYTYNVWTDDGYTNYERSVQYIYDRVDDRFKEWSE